VVNSVLAETVTPKIVEPIAPVTKPKHEEDAHNLNTALPGAVYEKFKRLRDSMHVSNSQAIVELMAAYEQRERIRPTIKTTLVIHKGVHDMIQILRGNLASRGYPVKFSDIVAFAVNWVIYDLTRSKHSIAHMAWALNHLADPPELLTMRSEVHEMAGPFFQCVPKRNGNLTKKGDILDGN
jgi:hypothetical protein